MSLVRDEAILGGKGNEKETMFCGDVLSRWLDMLSGLGGDTELRHRLKNLGRIQQVWQYHLRTPTGFEAGRNS